MNKVCCNINNRRDDGDSLVNILTVVGSSQESRDFSREKFNVSLISWTISMLAGIGVIIVSTTITKYKIVSTILLIGGIINTVLSFIVLAILVPYNYCLDKRIERVYKKLRTDYYKEIFKENETQSKKEDL